MGINTYDHGIKEIPMNDVGQMDNNTLRHAFEVGVLNRCLSNHGKKHWETVKMILRYLRINVYVWVALTIWISRLDYEMGIVQLTPRLLLIVKVTYLWLKNQSIMQRPITLECNTISFGNA